MNNPHKAYSQAAARVFSPAERDAFALKEASRLLREARNDFEDDLKVLAALQKNQLLWTIFITNMMDEDCGHDRKMRESILTLGAFVIKQGQKALAEKNPAHLDAIISTNINIAEGLLAAPGSNQEQTA